MIPPEGMQEISEAIAERVGQCRFYVSNEEIQRPPFRLNVTGAKIQVLMYLDDTDVGKFEQFAVISKSGKVLFEKPEVIEKAEPDGLVVAFSLQLQEVGV